MSGTSKNIYCALYKYMLLDNDHYLEYVNIYLVCAKLCIHLVSHFPHLKMVLTVIFY